MIDCERIYSIPAGEDFLETLAYTILNGTSPICRLQNLPPDNIELSSWTFLLPNQRSASALSRIFYELSPNRGILLPEIRTIGSFENDEIEQNTISDDLLITPNYMPAINELTRLFVLTKFVHKLKKTGGEMTQSLEQSFTLAKSLAQLIDAVEISGGDLDKLEDIVPIDLAAHWQQSLHYLKIISETWPNYLDNIGHTDVVATQHQALIKWGNALEKRDTTRPVIIAGSTGSVFMTMELMKKIHQYPNGWIILPGFENSLTAQEAQSIKLGHPQFLLLQLIKQIADLAPGDVKIYSQNNKTKIANAGSLRDLSDRRKLLLRAMDSYENTHRWHEWVNDASNYEMIKRATAGIKIIEARNENDEATAIAVAVARAAKINDKSVMIICPDRLLVLRIVAALRDLGVEPLDSAGKSYVLSMLGRFIALLLETISSNFNAVSLMALLQHEWFQNFNDANESEISQDISSLVLRFDIDVLRGPIMAPGISGLIRNIEAKKHASIHDKLKSKVYWDDYLKLIQHCERLLEPLLLLFENRNAKFQIWLMNLLQVVNEMRHFQSFDNDVDGKVFEYLNNLLANNYASCLDDEITIFDFKNLINELLAGKNYYPQHYSKPKVAIYGTLEGRLLQADLVIIAGCNDNNWPKESPPNPWLSNEMSKIIGIDQMEKQKSLAAHDFFQFACSSEVLITRAFSNSGQPTTPSRWLVRLKVIVSGVDKQLYENMLDTKHLQIALELKRPTKQLELAKRPAPRPPLSARPRRISVSDTDKLVRDPYAFYASKILKLKPLFPALQKGNPALYGSLCHDILGESIVENKLEINKLKENSDKLFLRGLLDPAIEETWRLRFSFAIKWLQENPDLFEQGSQPPDIIYSELPAKLELWNNNAGDYLVVAGRADRIDIFGATKQNGNVKGRAVIIDYKTGEASTAKMSESGFSNQLSLYAEMLNQGINLGDDKTLKSFKTEAYFIELPKKNQAGKRINIISADDDKQKNTELIDRITKYLKTFYNPSTPYIPRRALFKKTDRSDYDHLSRYWEWGNSGEDDV